MKSNTINNMKDRFCITCNRGWAQVHFIGSCPSCEECDSSRPIAFNPDMVRAVKAGTKTQTRRIDGGSATPPYREGQILWVREAFRVPIAYDHLRPSLVPDKVRVDYLADIGVPLPANGRLRGGRFMPKRFARLWLRATAVRRERLCAITEAEAVAEGVMRVSGDHWKMYDGEADAVTWCRTARQSFESLWDSIHGDGAFESNPMVWVVEFERFDAAAAQPASNIQSTKSR